MKNNNIIKYVIIATCAAILNASKFMMSFIPNVEPVTLLLIIYTLIWGWKKSLIISLVFVIVEGFIYGFNLYFVQYLFIWPLLVILILIFKNGLKENFLLWSIFSGLFGMFFGVLTSIPLMFIDKTFTYSSIITGLPFDAVHMIGNYIIMLLLGEIIYKRLKDVIQILNL